MRRYDMSEQRADRLIPAMDCSATNSGILSNFGQVDWMRYKYAPEKGYIYYGARDSDKNNNSPNKNQLKKVPNRAQALEFNGKDQLPDGCFSAPAVWQHKTESQLQVVEQLKPESSDNIDDVEASDSDVEASSAAIDDNASFFFNESYFDCLSSNSTSSSNELAENCLMLIEKPPPVLPAIVDTDAPFFASNLEFYPHLPQPQSRLGNYCTYETMQAMQLHDSGSNCKIHPMPRRNKHNYNKNKQHQQQQQQRSGWSSMEFKRTFYQQDKRYKSFGSQMSNSSSQQQRRYHQRRSSNASVHDQSQSQFDVWRQVGRNIRKFVELPNGELLLSGHEVAGMNAFELACLLFSVHQLKLQDRRDPNDKGEQFMLTHYTQDDLKSYIVERKDVAHLLERRQRMFNCMFAFDPPMARDVPMPPPMWSKGQRTSPTAETEAPSSPPPESPPRPSQLPPWFEGHQLEQLTTAFEQSVTMSSNISAALQSSSAYGSSSSSSNMVTTCEHSFYVRQDLVVTNRRVPSPSEY